MDTGVSKQSNAGRKETMVGLSEVVVSHTIYGLYSRMCFVDDVIARRGCMIVLRSMPNVAVVVGITIIFVE